MMAKQASKTAPRRKAPSRLRRTTVSLPADLLEAADRAVRGGSAKSRAELLARALRRELAAQRRKQIDEAFLEMATDPDYQADAIVLAEEAVVAGWEALRLSERNDAQR